MEPNTVKKNRGEAKRKRSKVKKESQEKEKVLPPGIRDLKELMGKEVDWCLMKKEQKDVKEEQGEVKEEQGEMKEEQGEVKEEQVEVKKEEDMVKKDEAEFNEHQVALFDLPKEDTRFPKGCEATGEHEESKEKSEDKRNSEEKDLEEIKTAVQPKKEEDEVGGKWVEVEKPGEGRRVPFMDIWKSETLRRRAEMEERDMAARRKRRLLLSSSESSTDTEGEGGDLEAWVRRKTRQHRRIQVERRERREARKQLREGKGLGTVENNTEKAEAKEEETDGKVETGEPGEAGLLRGMKEDLERALKASRVINRKAEKRRLKKAEDDLFFMDRETKAREGGAGSKNGDQLNQEDANNNQAENVKECKNGKERGLKRKSSELGGREKGMKRPFKMTWKTPQSS